MCGGVRPAVGHFEGKHEGTNSCCQFQPVRPSPHSRRRRRSAPIHFHQRLCCFMGSLSGSERTPDQRPTHHFENLPTNCLLRNGWEYHRECQCRVLGTWQRSDRAHTQPEKGCGCPAEYTRAFSLALMPPLMCTGLDETPHSCECHPVPP